jgi:hypothetical protein
MLRSNLAWTSLLRTKPIKRLGYRVCAFAGFQESHEEYHETRPRNLAAKCDGMDSLSVNVVQHTESAK